MLVAYGSNNVFSVTLTVDGVTGIQGRAGTASGSTFDWSAVTLTSNGSATSNLRAVLSSSTNAHGFIAYLVKGSKAFGTQFVSGDTSFVLSQSLSLTPTSARNEIIGVSLGQSISTGDPDMSWTGIVHGTTKKGSTPSGSTARGSDKPVGTALPISATRATGARMSTVAFLIEPA